MATRKKTTISIDADLLRAMKVAAAREDKPEYQVIEDALRKHLGFDLMERIRARAAMPEGDAMHLADEEVHAVRRRHARKPRS